MSDRIVSCVQPCRRPGRPCHRLCPYLGRTARPVERCRACHSSLRRVAGRWRRIATYIAAILRHKSWPQPQYKFVSRLPLARSCARARCRTLCEQADLVVDRSWPYRRHARRYRGPCCTPSPASPTLCHDIIHCIMTQMGSSPFSS